MLSFKPTFLYIKQHTVTGKLYFGKTIKDPEKYYGSGKYWKNHIKKHGKEHVINLWYCLFYNEQDCKKFALDFSKQQNIIESEEWANQIEETGTDTVLYGGVAAKTVTGLSLGYVKLTDPRWKTGEIVGATKGIKLGPSWNKGLKLTEEKYKKGGKSNKGRTHPERKDMVAVKDIVTGDFYGLIHKNDPRFNVDLISVNKGQVLSAESKLKMKKPHKMSDEWRAKNKLVGEKHRGENNVSKRLEVRNKISEALTNKPKTETHKIKLREIAKNRKKLTCEHCGRTIDSVNFFRWHGEKCKSKIK